MCRHNSPSDFAASDASASEPPIEGLRIAKPLVAHWTFDEQVGSTCHDASPNGYDALPEAAPPGALRRVEGVFGGALSLSGQHLLRTRKKLDLARLARITFSAWVVPVEMGKYSEIFRKEDGDHRVLFSFQDDGTHLSLGLNIGGYVECDASIRPQMVLDGRWHHCAATFDGRCMRVYLDGQEIGSLGAPGLDLGRRRGARLHRIERGGRVLSGLVGRSADLQRSAFVRRDRPALRERPRFAGSRFQEGRSPARRGFRSGQDLRRVARRHAQELRERRVLLDGDLAPAILARLKLTFPKEFENFMRWTGVSPLEYLLAEGNEYQLREVSRLVQMAAEYRPLTDQQKHRQTAADRRNWQELEAIERKLKDLKARGDLARFSPEWIEIILAVGPKIQIRPYQSEAVAPYVAPATPPTRNRTSVEACERSSPRLAAPGQ